MCENVFFLLSVRNDRVLNVQCAKCRDTYDRTHRHYDLGKEHDVSREQLPKECTDASGCKASVALARFQRRGCHFYDALVFEVDLFAFQEAYQKCTWRAYINETRLLLDKDATNGYWTWTIAVAKLALFLC
uniref:C2H2-type domain-containing protein n=1 Tax=Globodera pallida TaxID=36090 RepID=A0A183CJT5_GLOPA